MPAQCRRREGQGADLIVSVPCRAQAGMDSALEIGHEGVSSMDMRHRPTATAEENLALQPGVRIDHDALNEKALRQEVHHDAGDD